MTVSYSDLLADAQEALRQTLAHVKRLEQHSSKISVLDAADEVQRIIQSTAAFFSVTVRDLKGRSRANRHSIPRHIAMALVREKHEGMSTTQIGKMFNRDHGTVLNACDNVKTWLEVDPDLSKKIIRLKALLALQGDERGFIGGDGI